MKRKLEQYNSETVRKSLENTGIEAVSGDCHGIIELVDTNGVSHFVSEPPDIFDIFVNPCIVDSNQKKRGGNSMTRNEKIAFIKSFDEPPFLSDDIYYYRYPWQKFGCVSSGICMCWCWYQDDVIYDMTTDEDVDAAYEEIVNYKYKK